MKSSFRLLLVFSAILSLTNCDKPAPPAAATTETDNQLAEARDALQRQALEIETKTALMDKQLAEMAQSLKDRDNAELRNSLEALKRQNEELRGQAEAARRQSNAIADRIVAPQPLNVAPQSMALPDYSLFYERLAPFGRWFEVNGYGYCWRPTITVAGWRPYVDGCWVWSSLGWAWQSNEPFGWATYHYGRWVNLARYGWIWVPGSDWAPAWVAWRQSRDCVGWAPLPPEPGVCSGVYRDCDSRYGLGPASYTFISTTQFVSPTYINIYAPVTRQTTIFQQSVNVTQIVPSHSRDHAFVHQGGPPRGQMEQACRQPVPQRQVQPMHADQMPVRQPPHGRRDATAPVAMVELPAVSPGVHMKRPEIKERIQKPVLMGGFEGVPQQAAREIRQNIDREKETAAVQQPPAHGRMPHQPGRHPAAAPAADNAAPMAQGTPPSETAMPVVSAGDRVPVQGATPVEPAGAQQQPGRGDMPPPFPRRSAEAPVSAGMPAVPNTPAQETVRPAVAAEPGAAREPRHHGQPGMRNPQAPNVPPEGKAAESSAPAATPSVPSVMPAVVENKAPEPPVTVSAPESTPPAVVGAPPTAMPQSSEPAVAQPPVAAEKMAAEAEKGRMHRDREQGHAGAMEQRQQQEMQERALAEKKAAEQAAMTAEAEKSRMQAAAAQQEAVVAQQQRMAADQAAAETEKARQQAAATAAQQQQEMAAQQRATAERMASEQAAAAADAERARQQSEAAAMQQRQQEETTRRAAEEQQMRAQQEAERRAQEMAQRQAEEQARRQQEAEMQRAQEQARRAAEEQQMKAQQEAERRTQEMAQRQAEEQARRQQEAEMQRAQEQARRAAEEQQMRAQQEAAQRAQEMAQRQAEEQARRQQEAEMQRAQEQARRAAEEQQMRAQQEAAQRAQEMAQRQAEEQARRAQEEARRAAAEAAQRAAAEAARNQPQPAPGS